MKLTLINHRVDNGKLIFTVKQTFFGIHINTKELIQTNDKYAHGGGLKVWAYYPSFELPGCIHRLTRFCNQEHDRLLHQRVYDKANNVLHKV